MSDDEATLPPELDLPDEESDNEELAEPLPEHEQRDLHDAEGA